MSRISCQIGIIGGGIAGLWLLRRCLAAGFDARLFEARALGSDQTIAAQGIVHGGIKYTLAGTLTGASEAIAAMPTRWRAALAGQDAVDLSELEPLSDRFYMWSRGSLRDRVGGLFASAAMRGRVERLERERFPAIFRHADFGGQVWALEDFVLDVPSLIERLRRGVSDRIHVGRPVGAAVAGDQLRSLELAQGERVDAGQFLFCAGAGNADLLELVGAREPRMQRRPLEQVLVWPDASAPLYAHCISELTGPEPKLTITTHRDTDGAPVWYVGGSVATRDAASSAERIRATRRELAAQLPWIDFDSARFRTIAIDRAEVRQSSALRPDQAFAAPTDRVTNVLVCWPTKLTLAPDLGDRAIAWLESVGTRATTNTAAAAGNATAASPAPVPIAPTPWSCSDAAAP